MPDLRALLRLAGVFAVNLSWFSLYALGALLGLGSPAACKAVRAYTFRRWGRSMLRVLGVRLLVDGPVPRPPFLLVTNHSSYVDIPVLAALANGWFVAKADIARWPLAGLLARGIGTIFVEPGARRSLVGVGLAIEEKLTRGFGVFLFPEGGIPAREGVGEFSGALLEPAARAGIAVHCAAIRYFTPAGEPPAGEVVEWRRGEPIYGHLVRLLRSRGVRATVCFGELPVRAEDRKQLARELRWRVLQLHERCGEREAAR